MRAGTFSIVARDPKTSEFGVSTATAAPCVGAFLPFALEGVGAIATQAWVNVNLGYQGLELMRTGLSVKHAIEALLDDDPGRSRRQVVGVDAKLVFGFTGEDCGDSKGHILGDGFAVAGNILANDEILTAMVGTYRKSKGELSHRLLVAVEAGQEAGGDRRGKLSAALLVASSKPKLYHNLRVDMSEDPVREMRRLFEKCERMQEEYGDDEDGEELRRKVSCVRR